MGSEVQAGHDLINDYLSALDRRLPTEVVEELADGAKDDQVQRHRTVRAR